MGTQRPEGFRQSPEELGEEHHTLIASLSAEGIGASTSVEGATDSAAFLTCVEHFLVPTLKNGQIVVMDNLQVHKSLRVRELIEGAGAIVLLLPPYSAGFSPIGEAFSKAKNILRKAQARTHEALIEAIGIALDAVSRQDALGFFEHCGYHTDGFSEVQAARGPSRACVMNSPVISP